MKKSWQLQEAKNRFSELFEKALKEGPQTITRRGKEEAIIVSKEYYKKLTTPKEGIVDFFRRSPLYGTELDLERSKEKGRKVRV